MRLLLMLLPLLHVVWTSQSIKMTPEEYKAFKLALNGNHPVHLQHGLTLLSLRDVKTDKYMYVDIGPKTPKRHAGVHRAHPFKMFNNLASQKLSFRPNKRRFNGRRNYIDRASMGFRPKSIRDLLSPIYRNEVSNITPISARRQFTRRQENSIRRKRQTLDDDESFEEPPTVYADELSFGLSTAGGIVGGTIGGYLDTTWIATRKLIRSLEGIGLIALSQVDGFLDDQENKSN